MLKVALIVICGNYNIIFLHKIYYTEAYLPLGHIKNNYEQINDPLPEKIKIFNSKDFPKELKDEEGVLLYGEF